MSINTAAPRLLTLILSSLPALYGPRQATAGEWPTFRADARRSGNPESSELPEKLARDWVFPGERYTSPAFDSSPAVSGDRVFIGVAEHSVFSSSGRIVSVDAKSGKLRWEKKTRSPVFSSPSVAGGRVFIGEGYHQDSRCHLYAIDAESGEELWRFRTKSHVESSPHVEKDRVYFGAGSDGIYCLDVSEGREVWHHPGDHVDISPLVASGLVFAGSGYGEPSAFCLSAKDGKLRWRTPVDVAVWGSPVLVGNRVYFGLGNGNLARSADEPEGAVICLSAASGKEVWRLDVPDAVLGAVVYAEKKVFFGSRDGHLYAVNASDGEVVWKLRLGAPVVSSPVLGKRRVAAVSSRGRLVLADLESGDEIAVTDLGRLLEREDLTVISSPATAGGRVFVGTRKQGLVSIASEE